MDGLVADKDQRDAARLIVYFPSRSGRGLSGETTISLQRFDLYKGSGGC